MSGKIDFRKHAAKLASDIDSPGIQPVIEKELIHYEIFQSLAQTDYLDMLTFQGGTCLRLCYGAMRFSEDLDFTCGAAFDYENLLGMKEALEESLLRNFDVRIYVKQPKTLASTAEGVDVKHWEIRVNAAPSRLDLPAQKISLQIASVPSYTRELLPIEQRYSGLHSGLFSPMVYAESIEEIVADKLVSLAASSHLRYRDMWDLNAFAGKARSCGNVREHVVAKIDDYNLGLSLEGLVHAGARNARRIVQDKRFHEQLGRFLQADIRKELESSRMADRAMEARVVSAYESLISPLTPSSDS